MDLGYDKPLYLLAFDHRGSFEKDLFHATPPISDEVRAGISDAKALIFEGFEQAVSRGAPRDCAGVLVDEEFGAARRATGEGRWPRPGDACRAIRPGRVRAPVRRGLREPHRGLRPDLHQGPGSLQPRRRRSAQRAPERRGWRSWAAGCTGRGVVSFIELLVPATPEQLERCGGDQDRYDDEIRPALVVEAIRAQQAAGRRAGHLEDRGPRQRRRLRPCRRTGTGRRPRQGRLHRARAGSGRGAPAGLVARRGAGARFRRLRRG